MKFRGYRITERGFFVSTVGINEKTNRQHTRDQEKSDKIIDQRKPFWRNQLASPTKLPLGSLQLRRR